MNLTGPVIVSGRRRLRILELVGVSARRGPSYAGGQVTLTMAGTGRSRLRRRTVGMGQMMLSGTATARLARRFKGNGTLALAGAGAARRRRRIAGSGAMLLAGAGAARRGRFAKGADGALVSGTAAGYVRPGWATPGSIFDADFKQNRYFGPQIVCTRSTPAYVEDSAGNWTLVPANTLRRSDKGVLVEGGQTNSIRNSDALGAVAGTPGTLPTNWQAALATGISRQVVGTGTLSNGLPYIDIRFYGTNTSGSSFNVGPVPEGFDQIAASAGQLWTFSWWVQAIAAPTPPSSYQLRIQDRVSAANGSGQSINFTATAGTMARRVVSRTLATSGTTAARIDLVMPVADGAAIDVTLRLSTPQMESWNTNITTVGGASSPIRTTGTAAARASDVLTVTLPQDLTAWTMAGVSRSSPFPVLFGTQAQLGSTSDGFFVGRRNVTGAQLATQGFVGGASQSSASPAAGPADDERFAWASAATAGSVSLSFNGGAAATAAPTSYPAGLTTLRIGQGSRYWFGYIERLALKPTFTTNDNLPASATLAAWGG